MSRTHVKPPKGLLLDGWSAEAGGKHLRLTHPKVRGFILASLTPSDGRALKNAHAQMRRAMQAGMAPGYREKK